MARQYEDLVKTNQSANYTYTYSSLSGVDIKAVFSGITFGNLQAISYSITREKAPIYTMGSPEPRGFSRGKRGIAGSMIFIMFDSHALLTAMRDNKRSHFVSDNDEIRPGVRTKFSETSRPAITKEITENLEEAATSLETGWSKVPAWYVDQIPAFNIVLVGVDEMGHASAMQILGVEVLNEGYGISIDDIVSEQQMTFVARAIDPWQRVNTPDAWKSKTNSPLSIGA